jgi:hypothetical protein
LAALRSAFTTHPDAVGESYGETFGVAMRYSLRLFGAAFAALVHAFLPFLFERTASTAIKAMHAEMASRTAHAATAAHGAAEQRSA